MEKWYLMDNDLIIDDCLANSIECAQHVFDNRAWVIGDVISEADYIVERQLSALKKTISSLLIR